MPPAIAWVFGWGEGGEARTAWFGSPANHDLTLHHDHGISRLLPLSHWAPSLNRTCVRFPPHFLEERGIAGPYVGGVGVVGSQGFLTDGERALVQRLGRRVLCRNCGFV
jgi:hypothetical protein